MQQDTIAAFSTALGGAIAVVRISGAQTQTIAEAVWHGRGPLCQEPFRAARVGGLVGPDGPIDGQILGLFMPGPASYTGEDLAELHCHGGVLSARLVLQAVLRAGARHAEPGEFTKRAFLNGKMDLTQAEAVADVITAHTAAALHVANRQLSGRLGGCVRQLYDDLLFLLSELESRLDFPKEDLDWLSVEELGLRLTRIDAAVADLLSSRRAGEILRHGVQLTIAGPPNVGKSSLMNAILGRDRAIVTHIPGTTRDTLEELAHIRDIPVRLIDTAGIREARDLVERTGIERSYASMKQAELVLWVVDGTRPYADQQWCGDAERPVILVVNKRDLVEDSPVVECHGLHGPVHTAAVLGTGLEELYDVIERVIWETPHTTEPDVAVSARHAALLDEARAELADAQPCVRAETWELAAVSVRSALHAIGKVTGQTASPDVLDTIFARFCIGK